MFFSLTKILSIISSLFLQAVLASSSWDKTVRLWDVFDGKGAVETFAHSHDVLTVVYRPDGRQVACSTLDGQIHFWDPIDGLLMYTIEGSRDIAGGRLMTDRRKAANKSTGKFFTTLCYSADGSYILAGGSSRYICMYDVADQVGLHAIYIPILVTFNFAYLKISAYAYELLIESQKMYFLEKLLLC
jgi:periodic tryptophan protein 2